MASKVLPAPPRCLLIRFVDCALIEKEVARTLWFKLLSGLFWVEFGKSPIVYVADIDFLV